jgi:hypothetical protein
MVKLRRLLPGLFLASMIGCSGGQQGCDRGPVDSGTLPDPTQITKLRTDLFYGYYGDCDSCQGATQNHVNLYWVWGWGSGDWLTNVTNHLSQARSFGAKAVVLGLPQCYNQDGSPNPNAEAQVRDAFKSLQKNGLLTGITALYPLDEPDVAHASDASVTQTNAMLRKVMADFPELGGTKLAVIYGGGGNRPGLGSYDWVGFDDYDKGSRIFTDGQYDGLKSALNSNQRIMLVPGGADPWKQDPSPFFAEAELNPQVVALIPFVWFDNDGHTGIHGNSMTKAYCETGKKIKDPSNPKPTCP